MEIALAISALGLGLASGFHCIGMCGPIALSMGISGKKKANQYLQNLTYQSGRIFTYSILGALVGIVGQGFQLAGFQRYLSIIAGIMLVTMALFSLGGKDFATRIPAVNRALLQVKINLGKLLAKRDYRSRFLTGLLNGLLPCGMVYMALTASLAAGGIVQSMSYMFIFGLGTLPFMFGIVLVGNIISQGMRNKILTFIPVMMIVLGSLFILRGLELGIPYISPKAESLQVHNPNHPGHMENTNCH